MASDEYYFVMIGLGGGTIKSKEGRNQLSALSVPEKRAEERV